MGTALQQGSGCWLKAGASAYVLTYGIIYVAAALRGMRVQGIPPLFSVLFFFLLAGLSGVGLYVKSKTVSIFLVAVWCLATVDNWMKGIVWVPAYSDLQYTVMALLNFTQAISLAVIGEVWKR